MRDFRELLQRFDVREHVAAHPWQAVGAALMLGAWVGFSPPRLPAARARGESDLRRKLSDVLLSAVGAVAIRMVREAAFRHVTEVAKQWWEESAALPGETDVRHKSPVH